MQNATDATTIMAVAPRFRVAAVVRVIAATFAVAACTLSPAGITAPRPTANDPFLDTVQARTFRWFWDLTPPSTGLTPDRWPTRTFSSIAAIGFALPSYVVGAERKYVTRAQASERVLNTLRFLYRLPQGDAPSGVAGHKGFFYHFLNLETGLRFETVELSTIDTALLLAGVMVCREYFDGSSEPERSIRAYADSLYHRAEWSWIRPRAPLLSMGWHPERGFIPSDWVGYNEGMIVYILALGSPTYPIGADAWTKWTSTYPWATFYGQPHVNFAPLFGHQYSHIFVDFRGIQDAYMRGRGIDYFENSRRATLSQRAYAMDNPRGWIGYGGDVWGLTASDGPKDTTVVWNGASRRFFTYSARGAAADEIRDDGTLVPTAAGGSVPFAPEIAIPALKSMRRLYGDRLFAEYGFLDAFNPSYRFGGRVQHGRVVADTGWFDGDYLGIDQGPILLMIENYRTGLIWRLMRRSPYIRAGLLRAGFSGGWLD
jgi:hypothetical protein